MTTTATQTARRAYSVAEAAQAVGRSTDHIYRAIRTTNVDPAKGVHHLRAKKDGKGYLITADALDAWLEQHLDA